MLVTDIGYVAECLVEADLIRQGYVPFKPSLPSSEVDMIAGNVDGFLRLQVKSGLPKENGLIEFDLRKSNRKYGGYRADSFDVLCLVDGESKEIAYLKWEDYFNRSAIKVRTDKYIPSNYDRRRLGTYFSALPKSIVEISRPIVNEY